MAIGADLERDSDLLPRDLPPKAAQSIATFALALFVGIVLFACLAPLPEVVSARFVLKPEGGTDPLNATVEGTVEEVRVRVGSPVKAGDVLLVLRSNELRRLASDRDSLRGDLAAARTRLAGMLRPEGEPTESEYADAAELLARVERMEREREAEARVDSEMSSQHDVALTAARSEVERRQAEVDARQRRVEAMTKLSEQLERGQKKGIVAEREVLQQQQELEDAKADLAESQRLFGEAESALRMLAAQRGVAGSQRQSAARRREGDLREAQAALADKQRDLNVFIETGMKRLAWLEGALADAQGDLLAVRAPYDGTVVALSVERPGVAVARGQQIAEVGTLSGVLRAAIAVPETDAALVAEGQPVRLLLDAFPYTLHGVRHGHLTWVSPATTGGTLPAMSGIDGSSDGGGSAGPGPLRAGMVGEARIVTGSRTLIGYVLAPLRQVRESMRGDASTPDPH